MSPESNKKINIRVDISIEGFSGTPTLELGNLPNINPRALDITSPVATSGDWPVTITSIGNMISATGIHSPGYRAVWALAYPSTKINPAQHPTPDAGAVTFPPNQDGSWSYVFIPGAACDNKVGGPVNSTLLVWYDLGGASGPVWDSQVDMSTFHGF